MKPRSPSTPARWRGATVTVRVDPGRALTAVYGTLDRKTGAVMVTESVQMNAITVAHREAILARYPEASGLSRGPYLKSLTRYPFESSMMKPYGPFFDLST